MRIVKIIAGLGVAFALLAFDGIPQSEAQPAGCSAIAAPVVHLECPAPQAAGGAPAGGIDQAAVEREKADLKAQESMAATAFWMALLTLGQLLLAALGTLALLWTLRETRRSMAVSEQSLELARRAVEGDQKALALARAGLDVQTQTSKRQLRAYIDVNTKPGERFVVGQVPQAAIEILNCGQTPAYKVKTRTMTYWLGAGDPEPSYDTLTANPPPADVEVGQETMIGAAQRTLRMQDAPGSLTTARKRSMAVRALRLVVVGIITYEDIFDEVHTCRFCRSYITETGDDWRIGPLPNDAD